MSWMILIVAGLFEVGFAASLGKARETQGAEAALWWASFVICLFLSMALLFRATRDLPMGTAYAVWTGIGAVGTALLGMLLFKEPADPKRLFFLATLIASVIGLKAVAH
ncbi:MAG: DMT family transporter [Flavobacteriales bacterium]